MPPLMIISGLEPKKSGIQARDLSYDPDRYLAYSLRFKVIYTQESFFLESRPVEGRKDSFYFTSTPIF